MYKKLLTVTLSLVVTLGLVANVDAATLTFDPTSASDVKVGDTGSVKIEVDLGSDTSLGVDALVEFDPNVIRIDSITPSATIQEVYLSNYELISNSNGTAQFSFVDSESPFTGSFVVVTLNYTAVGEGTTTLGFVTGSNFGTTSVVDYDTGGELLTSTGSSTITVTSSGGSSGGSDDDDDGDDSSSSSSGSSSSGSGTTTTQVPETGSFSMTLFVLVSGLLLAAGTFIKKFVV